MLYCNPYHSEVLKDFNINIVGSDIITKKGTKIEIKETNTYKNRKKILKNKIAIYSYFVYTIHKKDMFAHDYFIFINNKTKMYYIIQSKYINKNIDMSNRKKTRNNDSISVYQNNIINKCLIITNNFNDIKQFIENN